MRINWAALLLLVLGACIVVLWALASFSCWHHPRTQGCMVDSPPPD